MASTLITSVGASLQLGMSALGRGFITDVNVAGRMITALNKAGTLTFYYSDDDGANWSAYTGTITMASSSNASWLFSLRMTPDGNLHCLYASSSVYNQLRTGTISGTTITWGSAYRAGSGTDYPNDLAVWRVGTTTYAAVLYFQAESGNLNIEICYRADSPGTWTFQTLQTVLNDSTYCGGTLDFHHTGDGRTLQGGTPHLYIGHLNSSGVVLFKKLTYSSGPIWTPGSVRSIGTGTADGGSFSNFPSTVFDGTRVVMAWGRGVSPYIYVSERDAADTTTTARNPGAFSDSSPNRVFAFIEPATQDIVVVSLDNTGTDIMRTNKYDRSGASWGGWNTRYTQTQPAGGITLSGAPMHRQGVLKYWGVVVEINGTSMYGYFFDADEGFNVAPNAPTWVSPADNIAHDVTATLALDWAFSDDDVGDTQSAYTLRRTIGATVTYWNGSTWQASEDGTTKISSATTAQTLASSWGSDGDATHKYAVKTWDVADAAGPFGSDLLVIPSAKDNPSISSPTLDQVLATASHLVTWTVSTQTKKRIKVYANAAGSPGAELSDSGIITDGTKSYTITDLANSTTYHVGVQTWNDEGLIGTEDTQRFSVSYTPPSTPSPTATPGVGYIDVVIDNPAGGATFDYNEVYRRIGSGEYVRIATNIAEDATFRDYAVASGQLYEYKVRTWATNGAYADGT